MEGAASGKGEGGAGVGGPRTGGRGGAVSPSWARLRSEVYLAGVYLLGLPAAALRELCLPRALDEVFVAWHRAERVAGPCACESCAAFCFRALSPAGR